MIKVENGESSISGNVIDIISDYTQMTRHILKVFKKRGLPDDLVDYLFKESNELARMTEEEIDQKKRELEVQLMMKLFS